MCCVLPGFLRDLPHWFEEGERMDAEHMVKCLEAYCEVGGDASIQSQ